MEKACGGGGAIPPKHWNGLSTCQGGSRQPWCSRRASHSLSNRPNVLSSAELYGTLIVPALVETNAAQYGDPRETECLCPSNILLSPHHCTEKPRPHIMPQGAQQGPGVKSAFDGRVSVGRDREQAPSIISEVWYPSDRLVTIRTQRNLGDCLASQSFITHK